MNKVLLILQFWMIAMYCNCSTPSIAGGSSQQGNGIIMGSVVSKKGTPAIATQVRIRPIDFMQEPGKSNAISDSTYDGITDSTGHFSISGIIPGSYVIEVNDRTSSAALIRTTIKEQDSTTDIGIIGLKSYAQITGVINTDTTKPLQSLCVQVRGLERLVKVNKDGSFTISDLPEGNFDLQIIATDSTTIPVKIYSVNAISDNTTSVDIPSGWRYSRPLYLNTTISGANITEDIANFPVLIRLTPDNFNFSQTRYNGADIRFAKSSNTFLPYEIEQWDSVNGSAEIWVKIDTVYGNNSTQFLMMYWGNENAVDSSNSTTVFDTSVGFSGVWHLSKNKDCTYDATAHAFNGKNSGTTTVSGIIGNSIRLTDGNHIKISGLLDSPSNVTLSAWVKSDTSSGWGQDIISIGDAVLLRLDDLSGIGTTGSYYIDSVNYTTISSGKYLAKTGWHYLVFSINNTTHTQTLYIDGSLYTTTQNVISINYTGLGTDTYIGIHGNGKKLFNFNGQIDEVRVYNTSVSPAWIRLCYMNQKVSDDLVGW